MKKKIIKYLLLALLVCFFANSDATVWQVGASKTYKVPSAVSGLVNKGDTVEIDAGTYTADVCYWSDDSLLLKGVGGFAHLNANNTAYGRKAIWVIGGANNIVENIEFSHCHDVPALDLNWAGIRLEGSGLTIRNCYFHDNDNGILGGSAGDVLIEFSEFSYNGYGDGYSHNIYINHTNSLTVRYCYFHHAKIGHELKSRSHKNYILYNRIMNEATGTASREIDLPNGGLAIIIGNLIQQGPNTDNSNILGYGAEGLTNNPPHQLYVVNNSFVNQRGANGVFISVPGTTELLKLYNNIFTGSPYTVLSGTPVTLDSLANLIIPNSANVGLDSLAIYDYNLKSTSVAINKGRNPGYAGTFSLKPDKQYLHPENFMPRINIDSIDVGAYEYSPATYAVENNILKNVSFYNDFINKKIIVNFSDNKSSASIFIYDIFGRIIYSGKNTNGNTVWNYNGFPEGVYFVKVIANNKEYIKKVVVN
ncbi:MAG: T9SS type A sorting domain-containing protein [Bacteroidales bacterium]|nr:T9SS type A sorting domain-containing protein [Bacteroidales bacterium]